MATTDLENYLARAAEARKQAEEATLDNVRDRCLRAAAAWDQMAQRVRRTERMRETLAADKERIAAGDPAPAAAWPANQEIPKPKNH